MCVHFIESMVYVVVFQVLTSQIILLPSFSSQSFSMFVVCHKCNLFPPKGIGLFIGHSKSLRDILCVANFPPWEISKVGETNAVLLHQYFWELPRLITRDKYNSLIIRSTMLPTRTRHLDQECGVSSSRLPSSQQDAWSKRKLKQSFSIIFQSPISWRRICLVACKPFSSFQISN